MWACRATVGLACCAGGCANAVHDLAATAGRAAGAAAPPAAVGSLSTLEEPESQRALVAISRSPAVHETSRTVGHGVGRGIVDELVAVVTGVSTTRPDVDQDLGQDVGHGGPPTATGRDMAALARRELDPLLKDAVRTAVQEAMRAIADPDSRAAARTMADAVGDGAVTGAARAMRENGPELARAVREEIGPTLAEALRQTLSPLLKQFSESFGPALHDFLQREVAPTVRQIWDQGAADALLIPTRPDVSPAVVQNARNLSLGTGLGTNDSFIQMGLLSKSGGMTGKAKAMFWGVAVVVALVGLCAGAGLVVLTMTAVGLWRQPRPAGREFNAPNPK